VAATKVSAFCLDIGFDLRMEIPFLLHPGNVGSSGVPGGVKGADIAVETFRAVGGSK
jgi:hypothetical protein